MRVMSRKLKALAVLNIVGWAVVAPLLVASLVRPLLGFDDWPGSRLPERQPAVAPLADLGGAGTPTPATERPPAEDRPGTTVRLIPGPDSGPATVIAPSGAVITPPATTGGGQGGSAPITIGGLGIYFPGVGNVPGGPRTDPAPGNGSAVVPTPELPLPGGDGGAGSLTQTPVRPRPPGGAPFEATPPVTEPEVPLPEPTVTPAPTEPPVETPVPTETPAPTETPVETPTPEPTETPVETPTPEPTETPVETPTPDETPTAEPTPADGGGAAPPVIPPGNAPDKDAPKPVPAQPVADRPPKVEVPAPEDDSSDPAPPPPPPPATPPPAAPAKTAAPKPQVVQQAPAQTQAPATAPSVVPPGS